LVQKHGWRNMKNKEPAIIFIRESDKKHFKKLLDKDSPFSKKGNKDVFIMAMITGFKNGIKYKLVKKDPSGFFRTSYLTEKEKSLIKAIAINDQKNLLVLKDKKKVYTIAEEYAAGGVKILKDKVFSADYGSFVKKFETELTSMLQKLSSSNI